MSFPRPPAKQPLPPQAKCVFEGEIFRVFQWDQPAYDGSTRVFEKLVRADTAIILPVTQDGKIIYASQQQPGTKPYIGTIGGRVDPGEDALSAAKRELLEESGYEAKEWVLLHAFQPHTKIDWCIWTFIAKGCHKVAEQDLDGGEKIHLEFADLETFMNLVLEKEFGEEHLKIAFLEAKLYPEKMLQLKKMFHD